MFARTAMVTAAIGLAVVASPAPARRSRRSTGRRTTSRCSATSRTNPAPNMQFQRREGPHLADGAMTDGTRDYVFAGADSFAGNDRPSDGIGIQVVDVTDPTAVRSVVGIACTGDHSDIAVFENLLVQTIDDPASNGGCETRGGWDPDGIDEPGRAGLRSSTSRTRPARGSYGSSARTNWTVVASTTRRSCRGRACRTCRPPGPRRKAVSGSATWTSLIRLFL